MKNCNRIGCQSKNCENDNTSITIPLSLVEKIYKNSSNNLCYDHIQESKSLFTGECLQWTWEYDKDLGTIDYYSKKKTTRKNFGKFHSYIIILYLFSYLLILN